MHHLLLTLTLLTQVKSILRTKNVNRGVRAASTISYKMERKKLLFFPFDFFVALVYGKEKNSRVVRIVIYIRNPCVYNPLISSWFLPSFLEAHAQF